MNVERLHELWTKYLAEGMLLPEEEQELVQAFRHEPALAEQLLGDVEMDGLLRALPENKEEAEAFARRFLNCVSAEGDTDRFVDQVFTRIQSEEVPSASRSTRRATRRATHRKTAAPSSALSRGGATAGKPAPFPWRELAIAAGVLLGIGVLYAILSPAPAAPPRRAPEFVRPPEPRENPAPGIPETLPPPEKASPAEPQKPEVIPAPAPIAPRDPAPAPAPPPAPPPAKPMDKVEPAAPRTITSVATLERIEGDVFVGSTAAKAGDGVPAGESVKTSLANSSVVMKFADGTRLELGAGTLVREIVDRQAASILESRPARGRRVMVADGVVLAEISKQPADQPMTFATPHGEARVIGTTLRLDVGKTTRLEVNEGRVRFTRTDGRKVEVAPGQFTLAGPGTELVAKPIALERRILHQWDFEGPNSAAEWERGTIDKTQTFSGSRGALKAMYRPDADYAVHAGLGYQPKPFPVAVNERTSMTFSYFISAPVEIKVQMRADRTKPSRMNIGYIIPAPRANTWTTVTVRFTEAFRTRVGLDDLIKPGITELDDIQFHAGPGDKPVDLYIDNVAIFE